MLKTQADSKAESNKNKRGALINPKVGPSSSNTTIVDPLSQSKKRHKLMFPSAERLAIRTRRFPRSFENGESDYCSRPAELIRSSISNILERRPSEKHLSRGAEANYGCFKTSGQITIAGSKKMMRVVQVFVGVSGVGYLLLVVLAYLCISRSHPESTHSAIPLIFVTAPWSIICTLAVTEISPGFGGKNTLLVFSLVCCAAINLSLFAFSFWMAKR